jgi:hypothetical protein
MPIIIKAIDLQSYMTYCEEIKGQVPLLQNDIDQKSDNQLLYSPRRGRGVEKPILILAFFDPTNQPIIPGLFRYTYWIFYGEIHNLTQPILMEAYSYSVTSHYNEDEFAKFLYKVLANKGMKTCPRATFILEFNESDELIHFDLSSLDYIKVPE